MRKVIVTTFLTLDGVMQAPGSENDPSGGFEYGGWTVPYFDNFLGGVMGEEMGKPFELLLGRKTYDIFAAYWPHHPEEDQTFNKTKKYVASRSDLELSWSNSVLLKGNVVAAVKRLKEQDGPDLQVPGSGNFAQTLFENDFVDELWLKIFPLTLGPGKRLFAEGTLPRAYELTDSKVSPKGVIAAYYKRVGKVEKGSFATEEDLGRMKENKS